MDNATFYAALFASPSIGVAVWDADRKLVEANEAFEKIFHGTIAGDVAQARTLEQLASAEQRASFASLLSEVAAARESRAFELVRPGESGASRVFGTAIGTSHSAGGVCLFFDVSERAARRAKGHDVASRMAAIGMLAGGVAHAINNPLAYAMGNLSFAIEQVQALVATVPGLSVVLLALRDALEGADRVGRTVRDLKTFSRPHFDSTGEVDLEKVVSSAISMARGEIQHRARLTADLGGVPPVTGGEAQLAQVFLTLLLQTAYGIAEGNVAHNEIRVTARPSSPGEVIVEISTTGAAGEATASGGEVDVAPGASVDEPDGLGLVFCRRLVEEYGGTIEAVTGGPSKFRVSLPASRASLVEPEAAAHAEPRRAKVLVVDDEPCIGSAITRILGPLHDVTAVYTAVDALARLESGEDYDVILCDLAMPNMTGTDLYRALETSSPRFAGRMVFMTGGPFAMRGFEMLETVKNPRLEKPFSPETLRDMVQKVAAG
jgi:CheY-like chemotaxis protein/signal transduction histidine kinase